MERTAKLNLYTLDTEAVGDYVIEAQPVVVDLSLEDSRVRYLVPNIYALDSWRRVEADELDMGMFAMRGVYSNLTQARDGFKSLVEKDGYNPSEEIEEAQAVIECTVTVMTGLVKAALQRAGVSEDQQVQVIEEITSHSNSDLFRSDVETARYEQIDEALWHLFHYGNLEEEVAEILDVYSDCLPAPYGYDTTDTNIHLPRSKATVQACVNELKWLLEQAEKYGDDSLTVESRSRIEAVLSGPHNFQPHWIDTYLAQNL